jgi:GNAT superfamily N-acetyltransferase
MYVALDDECAYRGMLGMGVNASHRGAGLGARLLDARLDHAPRRGVEKVELTVHANNTPAVALPQVRIHPDRRTPRLAPPRRRLVGRCADGKLLR